MPCQNKTSLQARLFWRGAMRLCGYLADTGGDFPLPHVHICKSFCGHFGVERWIWGFCRCSFRSEKWLFWHSSKLTWLAGKSTIFNRECISKLGLFSSQPCDRLPEGIHLPKFKAVPTGSKVSEPQTWSCHLPFFFTIFQGLKGYVPFISFYWVYWFIQDIGSSIGTLRRCRSCIILKLWLVGRWNLR